MICELCERDVPVITEHHLIPRSTSKKFLRGKPNPKSHDKVNLCQPCHSTIHLTFTNEELMVTYNTISKLKKALKKWIKFIEGKPYGQVKIRKANRKKGRKQ